MTECNQSDFGFAACGRREIVARFDGGTISSDGGVLLLRQTDQRLNLLSRLAGCFLDGRNPEQIEHSILEMLSQRIYGLALGYEDLNDHEQLRSDPVFGVLAGREEGSGALAGKSTLNRMELGAGTPDRYKKITFWKEAIDELLVQVFLESQATIPEQIILDVDTTDLPLHGKQEGRFFHGYYDEYCYLPLYIFCGEHVLCARLRESNHDAAFGSLAEIRRIVAQIRAAWPEVKIILRGDSGFCRNELMSWCESNRVDYVFGLARNQRLRRIIGGQMWEATQQWEATGKPARVFTEFVYRTKTKKGGKLKTPCRIQQFFRLRSFVVDVETCEHPAAGFAVYAIHPAKPVARHRQAVIISIRRWNLLQPARDSIQIDLHLYFGFFGFFRCVAWLNWLVFLVGMQLIGGPNGDRSPLRNGSR